MSEFTYPAELALQPLALPPSVSVTVPGSKSITNRALVLAALSNNTVKGALRSEDTEVMIDSLRRLGFLVTEDWAANTVTVGRPGWERLIPADTADLWVGNSGTTLRFLTALVSIDRGTYRLDGVARMRERPVEDLLAALRQVGVDARSEQGTGCPPVIVVSGAGWKGNVLTVRGDVSSQFLSGLILAAVCSQRDYSVVTIRIDGPLVSVPYVDMTLAMMTQWGIEAGWEGDNTIVVDPHWQGHPSGYTIEPDASAASYFWAAAAVTGGRVTVSGLNRTSLQGDVRFVEVLGQMGCRVEECDAGITVHGGPLRGVDVDMNNISDTVMTLGAVACFAEGPTTIRNVAHIRHKETDRIAALAKELRKLGAEVAERDDGLTITPRALKGCAVDTYNDHRMAMSLALVGLKVPEVVIRNPGCVAKTYPGFWQDWEKLRG
ncbi:3-phosphoshikimate 1-carboxyvinyltransferase [Frigoriglobus tundricola]|uniref:3-phosphoshikimate 1-carboxyvinyltransferase n=1 Tax=Frigoriglobus tundricola TaxID=2774151 RepID=A0A6M5YH64_9BACT|nr:3-phosphoshikimate 1-carboxyvinyltransferase [Frigoriglobus tundricola]QJW93399.1 3-phosphoshikimate 1-carboxyvinyltransferase [Frigoriglobus tundricola]